MDNEWVNTYEHIELTSDKWNCFLPLDGATNLASRCNNEEVEELGEKKASGRNFWKAKRWGSKA